MKRRRETRHSWVKRYGHDKYLSPSNADICSIWNTVEIRLPKVSHIQCMTHYREIFVRVEATLQTDGGGTASCNAVRTVSRKPAYEARLIVRGDEEER